VHGGRAVMTEQPAVECLGGLSRPTPDPGRLLAEGFFPIPPRSTVNGPAAP
jgi:hypothetical protein